MSGVCDTCGDCGVRPNGCPDCGRKRRKRGDAKIAKVQATPPVTFRFSGKDYKNVDSDSAIDVLEYQGGGVWRVVHTTYKRPREGCGMVVWKGDRHV